jgi:Holliday junction resolvasome RuvABC endonuclease subunit
MAHGVKSLRLVPKPQRRREARKALSYWLSSYKPDVVVLEATHRHPTGTFQTVHALARSLASVSRRHRRKVVTYPAQTVRKHLVGNGKARKLAVAGAVSDRFPALRIYLTQDRRWKERYFQNMFDAVALALHHRDSG